MSTKENALRIFDAHCTEWETSEERNSGYDYECMYLAMMQRVQREVRYVSDLQSGVGEVSGNKSLKKF